MRIIKSFFGVFGETASYRYGYSVVEVTNLVIESYGVIVIEVAVIEKGYRRLVIEKSE